MELIRKTKHYLKTGLQQSDLYLRFRYSSHILHVWKLLRKDVTVKLRRQQEFYTDLLKGIKSNDTIIFDIGANEGFTTQIFSDITHKTLAIEPSPLNARILHNRFCTKKGVNIEQKAVSDTTGKELLYIENGTALHTLNIEWKKLLETGNYKLKTDFVAVISVNTITLSDLIKKFGHPVFIKIDTEGYEKKVISSLNSVIPQLLFEAILPQFLEDTLQSIHHLNRIDKAARFNYAIEDKLMLDEFVKMETLLPILKEVNASADIICRMSNYSEYYNG